MYVPSYSWLFEMKTSFIVYRIGDYFKNNYLKNIVYIWQSAERNKKTETVETSVCSTFLRYMLVLSTSLLSNRFTMIWVFIFIHEQNYNPTVHLYIRRIRCWLLPHTGNIFIETKEKHLSEYLSWVDFILISTQWIVYDCDLIHIYIYLLSRTSVRHRCYYFTGEVTVITKSGKHYCDYNSCILLHCVFFINPYR